VYLRHGKGPKTVLRFTRTGDANLEAAYARHFVWPGKQPLPTPAPAPDESPLTESGENA